MVVIVVALDDCTISVMKAPQNAPDDGVAAALLSVARSPEPANRLRPPVMTLMPSRNKPTPPRTEIAVDMRAPQGAATVRPNVTQAVMGWLPERRLCRPGTGLAAALAAGAIPRGPEPRA